MLVDGYFFRSRTKTFSRKPFSVFFHLDRADCGTTQQNHCFLTRVIRMFSYALEVYADFAGVNPGIAYKFWKLGIFLKFPIAQEAASVQLERRNLG